MIDGHQSSTQSIRRYRPPKAFCVCFNYRAVTIESETNEILFKVVFLFYVYLFINISTIIKTIPDR